MWANRMPRHVLPVRRADLAVLDASRQVPSDVEDFVEFVAMLAENYFSRANYLTIEGRAYLSIYDSRFFIKNLGPEAAALAIASARSWLAAHGYPDLHLAAIEPNAAALPVVSDIAFDSVTHYVFLPDGKGPLLQDYREYTERRARDWREFGRVSGLPYMLSVAPGWDASPRGADFGDARPDKYPWSPVIIGDHPDLFRDALSRAIAFKSPSSVDDRLVFVSSLNEWTEGHYIESDARFGHERSRLPHSHAHVDLKLLTVIRLRMKPHVQDAQIKRRRGRRGDAGHDQRIVRRVLVCLALDRVDLQKIVRLGTGSRNHANKRQTVVTATTGADTITENRQTRARALHSADDRVVAKNFTGDRGDGRRRFSTFIDFDDKLQTVGVDAGLAEPHENVDLKLLTGSHGVGRKRRRVNTEIKGRLPGAILRLEKSARKDQQNDGQRDARENDSGLGKQHRKTPCA